MPFLLYLSFFYDLIILYSIPCSGTVHSTQYILLFIIFSVRIWEVIFSERNNHPPNYRYGMLLFNLYLRKKFPPLSSKCSSYSRDVSQQFRNDFERGASFTLHIDIKTKPWKPNFGITNWRDSSLPKCHHYQNKVHVISMSILKQKVNEKKPRHPYPLDMHYCSAHTLSATRQGQDTLDKISTEHSDIYSTNSYSMTSRILNC